MRNRFIFKKLLFFTIYFFSISLIYGQNKYSGKKNTIGIDTIKSQQAISLVLNYVRLLQNNNIDSLIHLSDVQFKRVVKWGSKLEKVEIFKSLDELRNSLQIIFYKDGKSPLLQLDTIYISSVNNKVKKKKVMYDEVYFVMIISKYMGEKGNIDKKYKSRFAVRMRNSPKIIGQFEE